MAGSVHSDRHKDRLCYNQPVRTPRSWELRSGDWARAPHCLLKDTWGGRSLDYNPGSPNLQPQPLSPECSSHSFRKQREIVLKGCVFELMTNLFQATLLFLYQHIFHVNGNYGKPWLSANCKKVFDFFLKNVWFRTYERNEFFFFSE